MFPSKSLVFISYSRKDKENVRVLGRRLAQSGFRTWLDTQEIVGGEWRREIKRGLRHSNFFVACLSQNTVQRGEVLQYEYDSALEIQRERLEGEVYIIPVRLEPCEIPDCFSHLQFLDLYQQGGWDDLIRALRSKSRPRPLLAATIALAVTALGGFMWLRPPAKNELLVARVQGNAAVPRGAVQLGVTLWKMEPSKESDPRSVREVVHPHPSGTTQTGPTEWTPVRLPSGAMFHLGDYFQIGIETSRDGYLYIVNRSFRTDGTTGPASLIFPTNRLRAGDNYVKHSTLVRLPDRESNPPYWEFNSNRPDYAGELFIVLLAPHPIEGLAPQEESFLVADYTLTDWVRQFGQGVRLESTETKQIRLTEAEAAARDQGAQLPPTAPPAQFSFQAKRSSEGAILGTLKIPVGAKR